MINRTIPSTPGTPPAVCRSSSRRTGHTGDGEGRATCGLEIERDSGYVTDFVRVPLAYDRGVDRARRSRRLRRLAAAERHPGLRRSAPKQSHRRCSRAGGRTARRRAQALPLARGPLRRRPGTAARTRLRRIPERGLPRRREVFPASRGTGVRCAGDAGGGSARRGPDGTRSAKNASRAAVFPPSARVRTGHTRGGLDCERTRRRRHARCGLRTGRGALRRRAPAFVRSSARRGKPRAHAAGRRTDRRCLARVREAPTVLLGRRRRSGALAARRGIPPQPPPASPGEPAGRGAGCGGNRLRGSSRRHTAGGRARCATACAARPRTGTVRAGRHGFRGTAPTSRSEPGNSSVRSVPGPGAAECADPARRGHHACGSFAPHTSSGPLARSSSGRRRRVRPICEWTAGPICEWTAVRSDLRSWSGRRDPIRRRQRRR